MKPDPSGYRPCADIGASVSAVIVQNAGVFCQQPGATKPATVSESFVVIDSNLYLCNTSAAFVQETPP
jgi:hypothetical protein